MILIPVEIDQIAEVVCPVAGDDQQAWFVKSWIEVLFGSSEYIGETTFCQMLSHEIVQLFPWWSESLNRLARIFVDDFFRACCFVDDIGFTFPDDLLMGGTMRCKLDIRILCDSVHHLSVFGLIGKICNDESRDRKLVLFCQICKTLEVAELILGIF